MPVNTAALKTFAPAMRLQLLEAVGRKLERLLTSQTPDTLTTYARQIADLRLQEQENRKELLEQVAYSWFNRLAALRYLDTRGWHPFGAKVLMPAAEGDTQPELLKLMRSGQLPAELKPHCQEARLNQLLDGQIPTAIAGGDPQGEVYRELVLAVCRFYHQLLPSLFESLDDATELLLPDDLLTEGSVAAGFRKDISDADCQDVEILGWLYQFYISDRKAEVMARKKAVPTEDIPAVTQLFTPHWIVRYLVENSLGRLWLLNRPSSKLREHMPYYIEGEAETDFLRINKPEEIKLLDPACGSGHMLTYAFDLLTLIYAEEGYPATEIPAIILRHNLFGLEICPRAAQLSELALVFKAREHSRRFLQPDQLVRPKILVLQDVQFRGDELNDYIEALAIGELFDQNLFKLLRQFEDAKTFGSLIQPCMDEQSLSFVHDAIEAKELGGQLFLRETHLKVLRVLVQAEVLTQRYHIVVANPPYMGSANMPAKLKDFAGKWYPKTRSDLFSMFIEKDLDVLLSRGYSSLVTMQNWMFLSSFARMREDIVLEQRIVNCIQIGYNSFPELNSKIAQAAAFTMCSMPALGYSGRFYNLNSAPQSADKNNVFIEQLRTKSYYTSTNSEFRKISGSPIAYWTSERVKEIFASASPLSDYMSPTHGIATGDNETFLRQWHEVSLARTGFEMEDRRVAAASGCRWFPVTKGGSFRKWYGNNEFVINWENDGQLLQTLKHTTGRIRATNFNLDKIFREGITWSTLTSHRLSMRYSPPGMIFESKGSTCFCSKRQTLLAGLALCNSNLIDVFLSALAPTLDYHEGPLGRVPMIVDDVNVFAGIAESCIQLARADWDNFESSWDFKGLPLLGQGLKGTTLVASWRNWETQSTVAIRRMQELETENNRLFIGAYGLEDELAPEVSEDQITLARADARTDAAAFLSYAVGCMMGRFSLDQPGLILANAGDTQKTYLTKVGKSLDQLTFVPDEDGIIPVLDGEWFEDDIVARTGKFLEATFGKNAREENLRFLEQSLGKDLRKYFTSDFYKNHISNERAYGYKKRPIYWMVQSPNKGFSCLIYLHRYTKDTLNQVLNRYLRTYLQKLEARLIQLGRDQIDEARSAKDRADARKEADKITKTLRECKDWERDALLPLAQRRIELDLDDGVKVNYLKFSGVLAPIPGLAAKEE